MYSGTTFRTKSGNLMGVHQKIDRVARTHIQPLLPAHTDFPSSKEILHFEGKNGPDGVKNKSPAVDEPWHYINPEDPTDVALLDMIDEHIANLATALKEGNRQRAAFEAAWMAHAITDGLTPPHHFPLEEKLIELRGEGLETRTSIVKKNLMPGETLRKKVRNNWEYWGAKGVMTTHFAFEVGVANVVPYQRFMTGLPSDEEIIHAQQMGYRAYYYEQVQAVARMDMYQEFIKTGWTRRLAKQTKDELMPLIIRAVVLGWLTAAERAAEVR